MRWGVKKLMMPRKTHYHFLQNLHAGAVLSPLPILIRVKKRLMVPSSPHNRAKSHGSSTWSIQIRSISIVPLPVSVAPVESRVRHPEQDKGDYPLALTGTGRAKSLNPRASPSLEHTVVVVASSTGTDGCIHPAPPSQRRVSPAGTNS
jgi:hypothetical protein